VNAGPAGGPWLAAASALVWFVLNRVTALALLVIASAVPAGCREGNSPSLRGADSQQRTPRNRLIVLDHSIGGIRLDEPRRSVEKAFGPGRSTHRGLVSYFGGRLLVDYWFHDQLTTRVGDVETKWAGFHTLSGVHVGSSRQELRALHVDCADRLCGRANVAGPDAPGTGFTMRHARVVQIYIAYS
jgi:hypothetical protein